MAIRAVPPGSTHAHAHTHPSPALPSGIELIRCLAYELNIGLQLRGLQGSDWYQLVDVYMPEVRRSPVEDLHKRAVKHLDVVSCWKGLSHRQAKELAFWQFTFKISLESILLDTLLHMFADYVRDENESVDKFTVIPCLKQFISNKRSRRIDVVVPDLVSDMIERFYELGADSTYTWFTSSHNLPTMVFNLVRMHDCFLDTYPCPSVEVTFSYDLGASFFLVGEVNWQPPVIEFYNLAESLPIGAEYRITCNYTELVLSQSFIACPADPEFLVTSQKLPLTWDPSRTCFRAVVHSTKSTNQRLETKFTAKIATPFPGNVRFERETRYSLFLEVEHEELSTRSVQFTSETMDISSPSTVSVHLTPESSSDCASSPKQAPSNDARPALASPSRVSSWLPSYVATPVSKIGEDRGYEPCSDDTSMKSPSISSVSRGMEDRIPAERPLCEEQWTDLADLIGRQQLNFDDGHQALLVSRQPLPQAPVSEGRTAIGAVEEVAFDEERNSIEAKFCSGNRVNREKTVTQARCRSWLETTNRQLDVNNPVGLAIHPRKFRQKRKASKQIPTTTKYTNPFHHYPMDRAGQSFLAAGDQISEELTIKRQRRSERVDSGIGMSGYYPETEGSTDGTDVDSTFGVPLQHIPKQTQDSDDELLPGVAAFTTGRLGEACASSSSEDARGSSWFATLKREERNFAKGAPKSRAYEAGSGELKIMPALKKKGSVKRMVFQKRRALNIPSLNQPARPCCSDPSPIDELPSPALAHNYTHGANISSSRITQGRRNPQAALPEIEHSEEDLAEYVQRRQREIADNYDQALTQQIVKESRGSTALGTDGARDGDEKAMERIFLAGSEGSGEAIGYDSGVEWESRSEVSE